MDSTNHDNWNSGLPVEGSASLSSYSYVSMLDDHSGSPVSASVRDRQQERRAATLPGYTHMNRSNGNNGKRKPVSAVSP